MKHLLIILSFLLLGCVKNQETEFLYLYESSSGLVFKSIGDGKVQPKYKGEITNGKPNGFGVMTFPDGYKYVGKFKDGERNGQGTFISPNGDKYVGKFKDGKFDGHGTFSLSEGIKYVGEWKEHLKHGQGTMTLKNGKKYVGEWKNDKEWNGIHYDKNGNIIFKIVNGKIE